MKKLSYILLSVIAITLTFYSCVNDSDYDTPQISCDDPVLTGSEVELANIVTLWQTNGGYGTVTTFDSDYTDYIYGYVVSDDKTGNFYKELFIQDKIENPTVAVKLSIDVASLYTKYNMGRKIYVYLKGLAIGENQSGELMIAEDNGQSLSDYIRENVARENIVRSCDTYELVPLQVDSPLSINEGYFGKYIQINSVEFEKSLLAENFVDPNDSYDSFRDLISCVDGSSIKLETSTFASFKNTQLPQGAGSVTGIISRDYDDAFNVFRVNNPEAFTFDEPRCDPFFLDGFNNGFTDWTIVSVTGNQGWVLDTQYGNPGNCAKISGFQSGNFENEDWLITPPLDLTNVNTPVLNFQTARNYNGPNLQVLLSTDYSGSGDPTTSTWVTLPATLSDTGWEWVDSGDIDLSAAIGSTAYVAFKYISTTTASATYEIDNVQVTVE